MSEFENEGEAVSEEIVNKLRKLYGPQLAARIEAWTLGNMPYPNSTLTLLVEFCEQEGAMGLPGHIGHMIDVLGKHVDESDLERVIAQITVKVNQAIAVEVDKL